MKNQLIKLDKEMKISIIAGILIVALSIAYYLVIFIPKKDILELEKQKEMIILEQENQKIEHERRIDSYSTDGLLLLINNYRTEKSLPEIKINQKLCDFTEIRAKEIQSNFSHAGFQSRFNTNMLYNSYCPNCLHMGENLAEDYSENQVLFNAWLASKAHKENLDRPFNIGCLGMYKEGNHIYVALELGQY